MSKGLTITNPAKFADAIVSKNIIPGDTLLLRGGTYKGYWTVGIGGTKEKPVTIKPYNKEKVVIDGGLTFTKPSIRVYDLEITDSDPDRYKPTDSITMSVDDVWLIGCHIHDLHESGVNWFGSGTGGVVECLIDNNGYYDENGKGHGHGIYSHNDGGGERLIARNLMRLQIGGYTIHLYSGSTNRLRDYVCEDNVISAAPVHTGGGGGLIDYIYQRNVHWGGNGWFCQQGRYSGKSQNQNGQILNNQLFNLGGYSVNADCELPWLNLKEEDNEVYGGEPKAREGYKYYDYPKEWSKFIPFTASERWSGIQVTIKEGVFDAYMVETK